MGYTKEQREAKKKATEAKVTTEEKKESVAPIVVKEEKKKQIRNLPLNTTIWVKSNQFGELIYISKNTGSNIVWNNYDSRRQVSLEELINMRNTQNKFFSKNWIVIESFTDEEFEYQYSVEDILDFLQVKQYYTETLCPKNIDDVFRMPIEQIKEKVPKMSSGVKNTIVIRANSLIEKGELYDYRVIKAIEESTGCELRWLSKE